MALLTTFFVEFLELFLPETAAALDREATVVLMQARFWGKDTFFLIHVENQSAPQADFSKRMFRYFARLTENTICRQCSKCSFRLLWRQFMRQENPVASALLASLRQSWRRLGAVPADAAGRLALLSAEQLDDLGKALLDLRPPPTWNAGLLGKTKDRAGVVKKGGRRKRLLAVSGENISEILGERSRLRRFRRAADEWNPPAL